MPLNRSKIIDVIKVLIATTVLTGAFLWGSEKVGYKTHPESTQEYTDDYVNMPDSGDIQNENNTSGHNASDSNTFDKLCDTKKELCQKINFVGDFPNEEKSKYLQKEDKIIGFVDTNNAQKRNFLSSLKTMQINETEGKRGYATRDKVVINIGNILSDDEFHQISTHELGHIADLGFLQGNNGKLDKKYTEFQKAVFASNDPSLFFYALSRDSETIRKAGAKKQDFCSTYGMSDPFEDFAECFNLYLNHNKFFKVLGQKDPILGRKYNFLASMFKGKYINDDTHNVVFAKKNPQDRVRDTTRITLN